MSNVIRNLSSSRGTERDARAHAAAPLATAPDGGAFANLKNAAISGVGGKSGDGGDINGSMAGGKQARQGATPASTDRGASDVNATDAPATSGSTTSGATPAPSGITSNTNAHGPTLALRLQPGLDLPGTETKPQSPQDAAVPPDGTQALPNTAATDAASASGADPLSLGSLTTKRQSDHHTDAKPPTVAPMIVVASLQGSPTAPAASATSGAASGALATPAITDQASPARPVHGRTTSNVAAISGDIRPGQTTASIAASTTAGSPASTANPVTSAAPTHSTPTRQVNGVPIATTPRATDGAMPEPMTQTVSANPGAIASSNLSPASTSIPSITTVSSNTGPRIAAISQTQRVAPSATPAASANTQPTNLGPAATAVAATQRQANGNPMPPTVAMAGNAPSTANPSVNQPSPVIGPVMPGPVAPQPASSTVVASAPTQGAPTQGVASQVSVPAAAFVATASSPTADQTNAGTQPLPGNDTSPVSALSATASAGTGHALPQPATPPPTLTAAFHPVVSDGTNHDRATNHASRDSTPSFDHTLVTAATDVAGASPGPSPASISIAGTTTSSASAATPGGFGNTMTGHVLSMVTTGHHEATFQLQPPQLGALTVRVTVQGRDVSAWFGAAQPQVQQAVSQALDQLQLGLAGAGLNLAGAWVGADTSGARTAAWTPPTRRSSGVSPAISPVVRGDIEPTRGQPGVSIYV